MFHWMLLVLSIVWISQEVPKPPPAAAPDTLMSIEQLAMPELACQDSLGLLP